MKSLYNILSELNNIFHVKGLIRFTFYVNLIDDRRPNKKNNESLDLTQYFKALTWKSAFYTCDSPSLELKIRG